MEIVGILKFGLYDKIAIGSNFYTIKGLLAKNDCSISLTLVKKDEEKRIKVNAYHSPQAYVNRNGLALGPNNHSWNG